MENSFAWEYFIKKSTDTAACKLCAKTISCKGKSTSGLIRHLKGIHNKQLEKVLPREEPPEKVRKSQSTLHQYASNKKDDMGLIVSKLAAIDGFSIRSITRSSFIRESMLQRGFSLPKTERDVQNLIIEQFLKVKSDIKHDIEAKLNDKCRFSLVMDEWTSIKNRRYLNICVYESEKTFHNLGMVYIPGKCGAFEIRNLMETRLSDYNINFKKHIVATITDGPNVMKKFVKESPVEGIFCLSHGLHLAVVDVFYKKTLEPSIVDSESSDEDNFDGDFEDVLDNENFEIATNYKQVLQQTRKIIKLFKKSPTKNCALQKYVVAEHSKEICLELDVVTRWNSMVPMMEKFLLLKNSIKKSLIDLDMGELWVEDNISILKNLLNILSPIKLAVEALCRRNINLLTADVIVTTLCKQVASLRTTVGQAMFESLKNRIEERRHSKLYTLIKFLKNHDIFINENNDDSLFANASKTSIFVYAEHLYSRLFGGEIELEEIESSDDSDIVEEKTFAEKLNAAICNVNEKTNENTKPLKCSIEKDLKFFEGSGKKTENIQKFFDALLTIRPTSVESERVFSLTGILVTKLRNRLSDESINAISVLKTHFKTKD